MLDYERVVVWYTLWPSYNRNRLPRIRAFRFNRLIEATGRQCGVKTASRPATTIWVLVKGSGSGLT